MGQASGRSSGRGQPTTRRCHCRASVRTGSAPRRRPTPTAGSAHLAAVAAAMAAMAVMAAMAAAAMARCCSATAARRAITWAACSRCCMPSPPGLGSARRAPRHGSRRHRIRLAGPQRKGSRCDFPPAWQAPHRRRTWQHQVAGRATHGQRRCSGGSRRCQTERGKPLRPRRAPSLAVGSSHGLAGGRAGRSPRCRSHCRSQPGRSCRRRPRSRCSVCCWTCLSWLSPGSGVVGRRRRPPRWLRARRSGVCGCLR